jgi:hypothetical protein
MTWSSILFVRYYHIGYMIGYMIGYDIRNFNYWFVHYSHSFHSCVLRHVHPKRVLHRVRSSASSFKFPYFLFSLRLSSSCVLPHLPVPSIFPSITCFRRHFLRKMRPIEWSLYRFIMCRMCLSSLTLRNISFFTWSGQPIFPILL